MTSSSLFNPFAIAWSLASATIESNLGACFFSEACNCKMASSAVRPAINRARSFSLRRDVLKLAVDDLCCGVPSNHLSCISPTRTGIHHGEESAKDARK